MTLLIADILRHRARNIGRFACIQMKGSHDRLYGNVIDVDWLRRPRRVRVQHGDPELAGRVLQPHQYDFCWWADEEED